MELEKIKEEYNHNLQRWYKGCNYLEEHPEDYDKYIGEIEKIYSVINDTITLFEKQYGGMTEQEILEGFKNENKTKEE